MGVITVLRTSQLLVLLLAAIAYADNNSRDGFPKAPSACTASDPSTTSSESCHPAPQCSDLDHVIILVMENKAVEQILVPDLPNILKVSQKYSVARNYYGFTHVSEPNYLAMVTGTNVCNFDDSYQFYTVPSLFGQLQGIGKSFKCYSQALPFNGYHASSFPTEGLYAHKHNPCAMLNTAPDTNTDFEQFLDDLYKDNLPSLSFVVPDQCHDLHGFSMDGTGPTLTNTPNYQPCQGDQLKQNSDAFVGRFFARLEESKAWKERKTLVVMVWDENDGSTTAGCCGSPVTPPDANGNPQKWLSSKQAKNCTWNPSPNNCQQPTDPKFFPACDVPYTGDTVQTDGSVYGGGNTLAVYAYSKAENRCDLKYPMNHLSTLKTLQHCWGLKEPLGHTNLPNVPHVDQCVFH